MVAFRLHGNPRDYFEIGVYVHVPKSAKQDSFM